MAKSAQIKKVSNWNEALSEYMIMYPEHRSWQAAQFFGVTEAWLSTVKNSDAFKDYHSRKRLEHAERISTSTVDKLEALSEICLDELTEKVEAQREVIPITTLLSIGKFSMEALGFGTKNNVNLTLQQDNRSVVVNDVSALEKSREHLNKLRERNDEVILTQRLENSEAGA